MRGQFKDPMQVLKGVLSLFVFVLLLGAAPAQVWSQEAPREKSGEAPQKRPQPKAEPKKESPKNSASDYSIFYKTTFDECQNTVKQVGEDLGHPQGPQCEGVLQACLNASFLCQKNNGRCEVTTRIDGTKEIHCEKSAPECKGEAAELVMTYILKHPNECVAISPDLAAPGCGNDVTEIGEDCDAGADNGKPDSTCNAHCKKPGTPDEPLPAAVCGNGVIEGDEQCDAGLKNGKNGSGCDIECKQFVTNQALPSASPEKAEASQAVACTMMRGEVNSGSGSMILVLMMGLGILLGSRFKKSSRLVFALAFSLSLGLSACGSSSGVENSSPVQNPDANGMINNPQTGPVSGRWLTGYYPSYQQFTMPPSKINYKSMTHLIHWPVLPKADGSLDTAKADFTAAHSAEVVSGAHTAGIKVLLGIGGDASSGATLGFQGATTDVSRATFITNIVSLMQTRGYDGVDINWEEIKATDDTNFIAFIRDLRQALDKVTPRPLLTMPPTTGNDARPELVAKVADLFDQINLQTYVMSGAYPGWVSWFNSPISNGGLVFPSTATLVPSIELEIMRFKNSGIPMNRMAIGIQLGGFKWKGVTEPRQTWAVAPQVDPVTYTEIATNYTPAKGFQKKFDPVALVPYLTNSIDTFISFDDEQAIQEKANFVRAQGMGGVFLFEITGDYLPAQAQEHPLLNAAEQYILNGFVKTP